MKRIITLCKTLCYPMNRLIVVAILSAIGITVWLSGCNSNSTLNRRSELQDPLETGVISVMMKDKSVYLLNNYLLYDSSMIGSGRLRKDDNEMPFKGEISFRDIDYIQVRRTDLGRTILAVAALTGFGIAASGSFGGDDAFAIKDFTSIRFLGSGYGGGDQSCPTVYSWSGSDYALEGEGFGTSWGRALEITTGIMLPQMKEKKNECSIRISNERPETHYINNVNIAAVESEKRAAVYFDPQNRVWPVYDPIAPLSAREGNDNVAIGPIGAIDGIFLESRDVRSMIKRNYRDEIELTFPKPQTAAEGTIIVRSINTGLFAAVLEMMSDVIGDDALRFVDAVEHDPEMLLILKQWLQESSLKVSQWNGSDWEEFGTILPEASEIPFTKVIRFSVNDTKGDSVRIKLTALHDVWKFDAVLIDWSPVHPLKKISLPVKSAITNSGKNVLPAIAVQDSQYTVLFPSQNIDCSFLPYTAGSGKKITYALELGGYLHEWFPKNEKGNMTSGLEEVSGTSRLHMIKEFLNERSIVLPVIYARWERMNEERAEKR